MAGGLEFASISAGLAYTRGVTTAGAGYCWGAGTDGRLGNGSIATAFTPRLVSGGHTFAQISVGGVHTCGVTMAGIGYCWGRNIDGNLGDGGLSSRSIAAFPE